jgi:hypothetical protein
MTRAYIAEYGGLGANPDDVLAFGTSCLYDSHGNLYVVGSASYGNGGSGVSNQFVDSLMLKYSPDGQLLFHKTWWDSENQNCGATNVAIDMDNQDRIVWLANNWANGGCFYGVMDTNGNIAQGGIANANAGIGQLFPTDITVNNTGAALISTNFQFTNPDVVGHFADLSNIPAVISIPDIINSGLPGWTTGIVIYNADGSLTYGTFNAVKIDTSGYGAAIGNFIQDGVQHSLLVGFDSSGTVLWQYQLDSNTSTGQNNACYAESVSSSESYFYTIVTDKGAGMLYLDKWEAGISSITNIWRAATSAAGPGVFYGYDIDFDSIGNPIVSGITASGTVSNGSAQGYPTIVKFNKITGAMIFYNLAVLGDLAGGETLWDGLTDPFVGHRCGAVYQDRFAFSCMSIEDLIDGSTTYSPRVLNMQVPTDGSQSVPYTSGPPVGNYLNFTSIAASGCSVGSYTPVATTFDTIDLTATIADSHLPMMATTNATTINAYSSTRLTLGQFGNLGLTLRPGTTYRPGVTLRGNNASVSFTLSSADFTNATHGVGISPNTNTGFTTTGQFGPGEACYNPRLDLNYGGSPAKLAELRAFWTNNGLNTNSYVFNVTWGAGSTLSSGVVIIGFFDYGDNDVRLNIGVVDTTDPVWQTPNTNYYDGPIYTLAGTWNLPATFTLITPLITEGNNWC